MDDRRPRPTGRPSRDFVPSRPFSIDGPSSSNQKPTPPPMGLRRPATSFTPTPQPPASHNKETLVKEQNVQVAPDHQLPERTKSSRRSRKKVIFIILAILLICAAVFWFVIKPRFLDKKQVNNTSASAAQAPAQEAQAQTGTFRLLGVGDIITHDSVNQAAKKPDGTYDYAPMLSEVAPLLAEAQARVCHNTVPTAGGAISGYPSFNASPELIAGLVSSGCNVMSLASDHINDKGQPAIDATRAAIDQQKAVIATSGANRNAEEQAAEQYFNVGNGAVKVGYVSYTIKQANGGSTPFGVNVYSRDGAKAQIQKMRQLTDVMVVSMCWGKEDSGDIQAEQDQIAQELADAGVDVVFGHCPHFLQPVKVVKAADGSRETTVYYSLGNTLNSQLPIEALIGGMAVIDIDVATKKIIATGFTPTYMHYDWTAAEKAAKKLDARKNLKLYPLDKAEAALASSQNGTTVAAQSARVTEILNRYTPVKIVTSDQY